MKQIAFLIVALASAMPARTPAFQQAPPDDGKREFIVSGCLLRNGYAGYAVGDSRVVAIDGKRSAGSRAGVSARHAEEMGAGWRRKPWSARW